MLDTSSLLSRDVKFPNAVSQFTIVRTYTKWDKKEGRRERFPETVDRYLQYVHSRTPEIPDETLLRIGHKMLDLEVLPSMRALWSAGEVLERDDVAAYNCAFLPIDNLMAFAETLYILMQGTGVGFSVENQFIKNLPVVQARQEDAETLHIVVEDSALGWKNAFYELLVATWKGIPTEVDYSKVRPAGSILHTKGGRASGPEPLRRLFEFAVETLENARGRRLTSLECHDIQCVVGEVVVVGGVRRSALISVSDVEDMLMRFAKHWDENTSYPLYRGMANNTAYWPQPPTEEEFWPEWEALKASGSGERGMLLNNFHNRANRPIGEVRTNPCWVGSTRVMTSKGIMKIEDLVGKQQTVLIDERFGFGGTQVSPEGSFVTGEREVFTLKTVEGYEGKCTADHRMMTQRGWVDAKDLVDGDLIHISNSSEGFGSQGSFDLGLVAGWLAGDGSLVDDNVPRLYFYHDKKDLAGMFADAIESITGKRPAVRAAVDGSRKTIECAALRDHLGDACVDKHRIPEFVWQGTRDCQIGYLSALFSADGSVSVNLDKGRHVRLHASKLELLKDVQQLLLNLGIASKIYENRRPAGQRMLPDGKGGSKSYYCEADHDLHISKSNLSKFAAEIGFLSDKHTELLASAVDSYTVGPRQERFVARFESLTHAGVETVYDISVPGSNSFIANGMVTHNCGEIGLRFRRALCPWTGEGGCGQFCNLTAFVLRAWDTKETVREKIELATILGTIQSGWTNFPNLRPGWSELCREDALLGVDMTGHCDNPRLSRDVEFLRELNQIAISTNNTYADLLGISRSAAITTGKPSGNSSVAVDCSAGCHTRWSPYYIRNVQISGADPLFQLARDSGLKVTPYGVPKDTAPEDVKTWVVEFIVKSPEGAICREDETALEQCERYLEVIENYMAEKGHNQSITIYVREHEWKEVGQWVFDNRYKALGMSFLPYDGGRYENAPHIEITKEEYEELAGQQADIDYSLLEFYEKEDRSEGSQTLACTAGACVI